MRTRRNLATAFLALGLGGCGTMLNLGVGHGSYYNHPRIYGATRIDVVHFLPEEFPLGFLIALLDLPFSLAFDTLTLPWSIPATINYGDDDPWPEPTRPRAVVEGVIVVGGTPGYQVVPTINVWKSLPPGLRPIPQAKVRVFARSEEQELSINGTLDSTEAGHFSLFSEWKTPWRTITIDCAGYAPVRISVSDLHDPTDLSYWSEHRLLVSLRAR